jgi:hypothetical protein
MKIKLTIAVVTLILLFTSSLSWAQDIAPFSLITVTPKSSDNQNIKYSVTFTNTAKKIHLEVPAIYSTDEINSSMPPFAKNLDKVSFTIKLKRVSPTGIASYTTIGKYRYVIPVINNPGAYSRALVDFSNHIGFKVPEVDYSVLPENDLILSDLYAKNFLEQITGKVIPESDLQYDSNYQSSASSSYQVISASGVVTNYKSSKGIGNFIPQFIKDFDLKGFVNNSKNIKKIGVLAGIGSIFDNDNESGINSGIVSDAYSSPAPIIARGSLMGLFADAQVNRIDAEDENPDNPNLDQLDEEFDETAKFLGDPQKTHLLIPDVTGTIAKIKGNIQKISDKISTRFGNVANKVINAYDWAKDFINSLNSTDFDKNKIQNALNNEEIDPVTPPREFVGITSFSPITFVVGEKSTLTFKGVLLTTGMRLTIDDCKDIVELPDGTAVQRQFSCTFTSAGDKTGMIDGTKIMMTVTNPPAQEPTITSYSLTTATLNTLTTFTFTGTNLVSGMTFALDGCTGIKEIANGTATNRQFSCTPTSAGKKTGTIKISATKTNTFTVTVTEPASTNNSNSKSGKCVTKADYINQPAYLGGWNEGCYDMQDNMTGEWKNYKGNGLLQSKSTYLNGKLNGIQTNYDSSGELYTIISYVNEEFEWVDYYWGSKKVKGRETCVNTVCSTKWF